MFALLSFPGLPTPDNLAMQPDCRYFNSLAKLQQKTFPAGKSNRKQEAPAYLANTEEISENYAIFKFK